MFDDMEHDKPSFQLCRELLADLSDQWQPLDLDQIQRTQAALLLMATATGLVECKLHGKAWTDAAAMELEVVVAGLWLDFTGKSVLPDEIRKAIPAWDQKQVAVQVEPTIEIRLTDDGLKAQADIQSSKDQVWLVMAYMIKNPQPPRIKLRLLGPTSVPGATQTVSDNDQVIIPSALTNLAEAVMQIKEDVNNIRQAVQDSSETSTSAPPVDNTTSTENTDDFDGSSIGGPQTDPHDNRVALWMGKRIYLGHDTQVSRLFWLLAQPLGRACTFNEVQRAVDGMETNEAIGSSPDEINKSRQRIRKAISNLRRQLVESELEDHVLINRGGTQEYPEYTMLSRFQG